MPCTRKQTQSNQHRELNDIMQMDSSDFQSIPVTLGENCNASRQRPNFNLSNINSEPTSGLLHDDTCLSLPYFTQGLHWFTLILFPPCIHVVTVTDALVRPVADDIMALATLCSYMYNTDNTLGHFSKPHAVFMPFP